MLNNPSEYETLSDIEYLNLQASGQILYLAKAHSQHYFHKVKLHFNDFYTWYQCQDCCKDHYIKLEPK